jgi:serine-type D-Ala-D-Ala endopeptidase (penicillin-binding protein 7)
LTRAAGLRLNGPVRRCTLGLAAAIALSLAGSAHAQVFPHFTPEGLPNIQSYSAIIVDLDSGEVLYEKNADEVRPIASTSKIFTAMAVQRLGIDLEAATEITEYDRAYAARGARSRLLVGRTFRNLDLLRALLIASDNRAATALARAVGLSTEQLVARMNAVAEELGLEHTRLTDPSGLNENLSTARELAQAFQASLGDPLLAELLGTREVEVQSSDERAVTIGYRNTNRSLHSAGHDVFAGKTGYTTPALYCLLIAAEVESRRLGMVFLGSYGKLTRFGDFSRASRWVSELAAAGDAQIATSGDVRGLVPATN